MSWRRGLLVRIAMLPFVFIAVSLFSFVVLYSLGSEQPQFRLAGQGATAEQVERIEESLDLDDPVLVAYLKWLGNAATGDFGYEYRSSGDGTHGEPIADGIQRQYGATLELTLIAVLLGLGIASLLAYAIGRRGAPPYVAAVAVVLGSVPFFAVLIPFILLPSEWWGYSPPIGGYEPIYRNPEDNLQLLVPPALTIGMACAPAFLPSLRSLGAGRNRVVSVLRGCAIVTPLAISTGIVAERLFSVEGLGQWLFVAALVYDLPVVHAVFTLVSFVSIAFAVLVSIDAPAEKRGALLRPQGVALRVVYGAAAVLIVLLAIATIVRAFGGDANDLDAAHRLDGVSWEHAFGRDQFGRDMAVRVALGVWRSFTFTAWVMGLGFAPGLLAGAAAGVIKRGVPDVLARVGHVTSAIPWLALALLFAAAFGAGTGTAARAMSVIAFLGALRVAPAVGRLAVTRPFRLWPDAAPVASAAASVCALAMLAEATIAFLGLGAPGIKRDVSLGGLIMDGSLGVTDDPHLFVFPAAALFLLLLSLNAISAALARAEQTDAVAPT